jgi:hypothetical protein
MQPFSLRYLAFMDVSRILFNLENFIHKLESSIQGFSFLLQIRTVLNPSSFAPFIIAMHNENR